MKILLLVLATIQLTINCFGLELVKCGSVKIPEGFDTNQFSHYTLIKAKHDGTSLFSLGNRFIVLKPFVGNSGFIDGETRFLGETVATNDWSYLNNNGVTSISFTRTITSSWVKSDVNVIFSTFSEAGYIDLTQVYESKVVEEARITNGIDSRRVLVDTRVYNDYLSMVDLGGKIIKKISLGEMGFLPRTPIQNEPWGSYGLNKKIVLPKLNGDSIDFYLVTDPDLFPDTALGSPRVEGGSATFNVNTSSEEPVEIQSSSDLKVWKRIQSLENANRSSVTVPVGSDKEFLRAVER